MRVNEIGYDEKHTDSLVNCNDFDVMNAARRLMYAVAGTEMEPKALFKKLFGKQMTTVNYSQRNWIWTFTDGDDNAWVWPLISTRGIAWEYHRLSDLKALLPLIEEIILAVEEAN